MTGGVVPRREDGSMDWERAGVYWRVWAWVDWLMGTDFCGVRGED